VPQALVVVPATQVPPFTQPVHVLKQRLATQVSDVLAFPSLQSEALVHSTHTPAGEQRGVPPAHGPQESPSVPHLASLVPPRQADPSRQPVQQEPP